MLFCKLRLELGSKIDKELLKVSRNSTNKRAKNDQDVYEYFTEEKHIWPINK